MNKYAHARGVDVPVGAVVNMVTMKEMKKVLVNGSRELRDMGLDAVIVSDPALIESGFQLTPMDLTSTCQRKHLR